MTTRELLAEHSAVVRNLVEKLRRILNETMPEADERVAVGWHALTYHDPEAGYICGIFPFEDHVKIYFEHGVMLDDPAKVLQGTTQQTRFVMVSKAADIRPAPLRLLIGEAIAVTSRIRRARARSKRPPSS